MIEIKYIRHTLFLSLFILIIITPIFVYNHLNEKESPINIELWYTYEGAHVIYPFIEQFEGMHPNVNIEFYEQPSSGWLDKFISVAQTNDAPDIFLGKGHWLGQLADLGYIRELTPFVTPQQEIEFLPFAVESLSYKNELYGLPLWLDSTLLFYNKDLFDANNVSYPSETWNETDFVNTAIRLTDRSVNQIYGLAWNTLSPYMWPSFQFGFGHGSLYQNNTIVINDTASIKAMEFIYALKYMQRCVKYDDSSSSATQAFINNKAAMIIYGGWYVKTLLSLDINFGLQILPTVSSTNMHLSPLTEVKGWAISKDTENPDLCFELISFLSSKEVQLALIQEEYKVPTLIELLDSPVINNDPYMKTQIEQIQYSQADPMDPIYDIYSDYMRAALQFILYGHRDIKETLDEAQAGIIANSGGL
ncbi:MAG: sugar ABC transporter substrate-binding protein [Candidatus Heimdallarchaeaceae archaeon]